MAWPLKGDYSDAIQNPQHCFDDPILRSGRVKESRLGGPWVASGRFALVYQIITNRKTYAVRCFQYEVTDQQVRYGLLSGYLQHFWTDSLVEFKYMPRGIRISADWHPIVRMESVDGERLDTYVERNLKNPRKLLDLAQELRGVVTGLRAAHLAHGDLQHGNVLVTPQGKMRLVDYDGMFAPIIAKKCGRKSPELGHRNYQHPARSEADFNENLDDFSALVIYLSLRALASDPGLWTEFYDEENLIFRGKDFEDTSGPVIQRLKQNPDPGVRQLTERLIRFGRGPISQVQDLETVLADLKEAPVQAKPQPTLTPAKPQPTPTPAKPQRAMAQARPQPAPAQVRPQPQRLPKPRRSGSQIAITDDAGSEIREILCTLERRRDAHNLCHFVIRNLGPTNLEVGVDPEPGAQAWLRIEKQGPLVIAPGGSRRIDVHVSYHDLLERGGKGKILISNPASSAWWTTNSSTVKGHVHVNVRIIQPKPRGAVPAVLTAIAAFLLSIFLAQFTSSCQMSSLTTPHNMSTASPQPAAQPPAPGAQGST